MKKDSRITGELKRIAAQCGGFLRPADVVEAARPKTSPLHNRFCWDDTKAAREYRLWQARQLIRVTVSYIEAGDDDLPYSVLVSLRSDRIKDGGGYRVTADVMTQESRLAELLSDAIEEMQRFKAKYKDLVALSEVFAAMTKAEVRALKAVAS